MTVPIQSFSDLRRALVKSAEQRVRREAARWKRARSKAKFVCVTGSSGKSTTSTLLAHILNLHRPTASQTISNTFPWLQRAVRKLPADLAFAVFETGIAKKGDMDPITGLLQPDMAIVTLVTNEHYSSFRGRQGVAEEKGKLVAAVRPGGCAILNADDDQVIAMAALTEQKVITFSRHKAEADYLILPRRPGPEGLTLEIKGHGRNLELQTGFLAEHFWVPTAAAAIAALELGVPDELVVEGVATFPGLFGRFYMMSTRRGPQFILDTTKAPWDTLITAIESFGRLDSPRRKRIILGHIADYRGNPRPKYREACQVALRNADEVVLVGDNQRHAQVSEEVTAAGAFKAIRSVGETAEYLRRTATPDDLIFLKSSSNLHLERLALDWDHSVRCWEQECGMAGSCKGCGLFSHPFSEHPQLRKAKKRLSVPAVLSRLSIAQQRPRS
ncbi:Mur ligase family protein [Pseudohoeflea coraliihabitans]|uniref:UDP-N-acetylmuramoyl-tripeptide--D-alanyl-D-alanine ligase n=1 Tax=Pseudohoeflea coraliihabitans TaxID=2860393 RepID=A0ABS6WIC5_9HYPH|nr:Mur ligase family protein [Pseudohoeflea sp. DP4N28-3]MBW3095708.1 UDP-N-acetylmuramoyl-tripeptide--D-alanyl-D-alanine ligase [Pseudohoeflea sp. DP4N28-3]